jgi:hypothetical protein
MHLVADHAHGAAFSQFRRMFIASSPINIVVGDRKLRHVATRADITRLFISAWKLDQALEANDSQTRDTIGVRGVDTRNARRAMPQMLGDGN